MFAEVECNAMTLSRRPVRVEMTLYHPISRFCVAHSFLSVLNICQVKKHAGDEGVEIKGIEFPHSSTDPTHCFCSPSTLKSGAPLIVVESSHSHIARWIPLSSELALKRCNIQHCSMHFYLQFLLFLLGMGGKKRKPY
jgi:hypothetical protein